MAEKELDKLDEYKEEADATLEDASATMPFASYYQALADNGGNLSLLSDCSGT